MPNMSRDEFKQLLARDLPTALVTLPTPDGTATNGDDGALEPAKPGTRPANMLLTNDALVAAAALPDVARYLRDTLGYELLSNITAIDYLDENLIEVVYHFTHFAAGVLVVKTRVPRDAALLPSLTPFWPGADFQEREAFDLFGVTFTGHPHLRRIYMWDEFEGFPMRKDFPKQGDKYFADSE